MENINGTAKTNMFKKRLKTLLKESYGIKLNDDNALSLFRAMNKELFDFLLTLPVEKDKEYLRTLTLANIASYRIVDTKDPNGNIRPKFKIYPSINLQEECSAKLVNNEKFKILSENSD